MSHDVPVFKIKPLYYFMQERPSLILTENKKHIREKLTDMSPGIVFQLNIDGKDFLWLKSGMAYIPTMIENLKPHLNYKPAYYELEALAGELNFHNNFPNDYDFWEKNAIFSDLFEKSPNNVYLKSFKGSIINTLGEEWLGKPTEEIYEKCIEKMGSCSSTVHPITERLQNISHNKCVLTMESDGKFQESESEANIHGVGMCNFYKDRNTIEITPQMPHELFQRYSERFDVPSIDSSFGTPKTGVKMVYVSELS